MSESQREETSGRRRRKNSRKKNGARPVLHAGIKTKVLLREIRRRRHRAAILEALSSEVIGMFSECMGGTPRYAVGDGGRLIETADLDVVMTISHELAVRSQRDKDIIRALIEMDVTEVSLGESIVAEELDEQEDADEMTEILFSTRLLGAERLRARNEKKKP